MNSPCRSQPLRHSDRIWREMRQNDRVNEVFDTSSTRRSTQEEIISATSSKGLSGPHSGDNIFSVAFFRLQANKFIPSSSAAISVSK